MIDNDWRYLIGIIDCISAYLIVYPMLVKISWNMMETVSLIVTKIEWEMVPSGIFTWITWHSGKSTTDFRVFNFPAVHLHLVRGFPSGPPCLMTPEGANLIGYRCIMAEIRYEDRSIMVNSSSPHKWMV